jgi:general secretion pathway protein D
VFIRPRILRDGVDAAIETNAKYNYVRDQQLKRNNGKVTLMPGEHQPTLPALESLVPPALLNPAQQAAPPGTSPAERATTSESSDASPPATVPLTPTTPFGATPQPVTPSPLPPPPPASQPPPP